MTSSLYNRAVELVDQLSFSERTALVTYILGIEETPLTLETIEAAHARRVAAGEIGEPEDLYGRFRSETVANLSTDQLRADFYEFSTAWEEDLDDFIAADD